MQQPQPSLIFLRQSSGISHQHAFIPNLPISALLSKIFPSEPAARSTKLKALSKGRLLDINLSLQENNLKPNDIIHLLVLARAEEERGSVYLSFEDKVYRIQFAIGETVRQLKARVMEETRLPVDSQIILFNSIRLEDSKLLKDYELRNGDFLCMAELKTPKPHILDFHQVIFPKKSSYQKRRGSENIHKNDPVLPSPTENILQSDHTRKQRQKLFASTQNAMSFSQQYGPSPLSEYDPQFKTCMEDWMKMQPEQPETISEQFLQEMTWTEENLAFEEAEGKQQGNQGNHVEEVFTPSVVLSPSIGDKIVLCESYNYEGSEIESPAHHGQTSQFKKLQKLREAKFNGQRIIPRFANSIELESPTPIPQLDSLT